jgi:hypothetical protein
MNNKRKLQFSFRSGIIHPSNRIQHQLNQQGLTAIDEAFEHANSLGP